MAGRKGKYHTHVQPRLDTILAWRREGLTEAEICDNLGVGHSAFATYKQKYSELTEVLKEGLDDANAQVENALFKRAIGYSYEEKEYSVTKVDGKDKKVLSKVTKKSKSPHITAQIFWLKNRKRQYWRDRQEHEFEGNIHHEAEAEIVITIPDNGMRLNNGRDSNTGRNKPKQHNRRRNSRSRK
jgi:hypothetical protein